MSFTHTVGTTYKTDAGTVTSVTNTYTGPTDLAFDGTIAASTTNHEIDLVFDKDAILAVMVYAGAAGLTIKTNSTSVPDNTITLAANQQVIWASTGGGTNPFDTADVTKLFVTNASSTTAATLKIRILLNIS